MRTKAATERRKIFKSGDWRYGNAFLAAIVRRWRPPSIALHPYIRAWGVTATPTASINARWLYARAPTALITQLLGAISAIWACHIWSKAGMLRQRHYSSGPSQSRSNSAQV